MAACITIPRQTPFRDARSHGAPRISVACLFDGAPPMLEMRRSGAIGTQRGKALSARWLAVAVECVV